MSAGYAAAAEIRHASAILADWAEADAGFSGSDIDTKRAELIDALDRLVRVAEAAEALLAEKGEHDENWWRTRVSARFYDLRAAVAAARGAA